MENQAGSNDAPLIAQTHPELAVYVHWPYCQAKCPYCDFNSYARQTLTEAEFVGTIRRELRFYREASGPRVISSVFFGGGTPSLMSGAGVGSILDGIAGLWPVTSDCEITLEANPSSVEAGRFRDYRMAGVNRVSVGIQSLHDDQLRFLGRLHTAAEARKALEVAARTFDRFSFDLIYARPGQTENEWRHELTDALKLASSHISLYQLTIEPETAFFDLEKRGRLRVPEADAAAGLYELTQGLCDAAGLPAYEVSNHARAGHESRHNLTYWRYGEYVGVGPGAHGRVVIEGERCATAAIRAPQAWHDAASSDGLGASITPVSAREQAEEMLMMGLRLREGVSLEALRNRTGFALPETCLHPLVADGLLVVERGPARGFGITVRATPGGMLVLNAIVAELARHLYRIVSF